MQAVPGWLCSPPPPASHSRRSLRPPAGRPSLVQNRLISTTSAVEISGDREHVRRGRAARYDHARRNKREEPSAWHGSIPLIHGRPFDRSPITCATASSAETCGRVACCRRKPSCLPSSAHHDPPSVTPSKS